MNDDARELVPDGPARGGDCFDVSLAAGPTLVLSVADVVDLLHVSHAPERIAEYREEMRRGARFPPVSVVRFRGRFYLADGHKRFSACRELGADRIPVEVWGARRWLGDQARQLVSKSRSQWSVLSRIPFDPRARSRAKRMFWDSLGHWRRIAVSLATLRRRRRQDRDATTHEGRSSGR